MNEFSNVVVSWIIFGPICEYVPNFKLNSHSVEKTLQPKFAYVYWIVSLLCIKEETKLKCGKLHSKTIQLNEGKKVFLKLCIVLVWFLFADLYSMGQPSVCSREICQNGIILFGTSRLSILRGICGEGRVAEYNVKIALGFCKNSPVGSPSLSEQHFHFLPFHFSHNEGIKLLSCILSLAKLGQHMGFYHFTQPLLPDLFPFYSQIKYIYVHILAPQGQWTPSLEDHKLFKASSQPGWSVNVTA